MNQFVSLRHGIPPEIQFCTDEEKWAYGRECQSIRDALPAGEMRVAPRDSICTPRGRPFEAGAVITAADFRDAAGAPKRAAEAVDFSDSDNASAKLEELVLSGRILRSDRETEEEREAIAEHTQKVRDLNEAFVADTPSAKLDKLLEGGTYGREP
jgi:hypothetical protein